MAIFFVCSTAHADSAIIDRIGSVFDSIARALHIVGQKSEDLVGPGLAPLRGIEVLDSYGEVSATREFEKVCPVQPGAIVSVSNTFGGIRVDTWDDQVVRVSAHIAVSAETDDLAAQVARSIEIRVEHEADRVAVSTHYPDTQELGEVAMQVSYTLTVPRDAQVVCENTFGDTLVRGVGGRLAVEARYGVVDLREISGAAHVRARGEFPLQAYGLRQGGTFELHNTHAEFSDIDGSLRVSNFMGAVELRNLAPGADVDVRCDSGPIHLYLSEDASPDLEVSAVLGEVQSDVQLDRTSQGRWIVARKPDAEAPQHIALFASFGDIHIHREGINPQPASPGSGDAELVKWVIEHEIDAPEGTPVAIEAVTGNIRVEGVDDTRIHVTGELLVRVRTAEQARPALDALRVSLEKHKGEILVLTQVLDDIASLGCTYYRGDLIVKCPRTAPLAVRAESGRTVISGMGVPVYVEQEEGVVTIEHAKGELRLVNRRGDIEVLDCAGPVTATTTSGTLITRNIYGKQKLHCVAGKTVIDGPNDAVEVHNEGGDVRIIALDGIGGDYDVSVQQGNLSIVVPPTADATFLVTVENGTVRRSAIPLSGSIEKGSQKFLGQLNNGLHTVTLEARDGDIIID